MPITEYGDLKGGFIGSLYSTAEPLSVHSAVNAATIEMPIGVAVARGTGDGTAIVPAATNADLIGVVMISGYEKAPGKEPVIPIGLPMNYLTQGEIYVNAVTTVAPSDSVYVIASGVDAGKFTKTSGANTIALPNARWLKTTDEVGAAPVRVAFR